MTFVPTPFYAAHPNDNHGPRQDFMAPINTNYNMSFGGPFPTFFNGVPAPSFPTPNNISATQPPYELPPSLMNGVTNDAGFPPVLPTYNPHPHFQTPFSSTTTSSQFFSGLPTSSENTLAPSPGPSRGNLPKPKRNTSHKPKVTKAKLIAAKKRRAAQILRPRGNTRRKPHSGFEDMFNKLPLEVQRALNTSYTGCCEAMTDRDNSTRQKHMFSKRHCENLPEEYMDIVPCFVCPAFIAFHDACTRSQPGRYDSAERHTRNCAGFEEMSSKGRILHPVEITKGEHSAITTHRKQGEKAEEKENTRRSVIKSVNQVLEMVLGPGGLQIHEDETNLDFPKVIRAILESSGVMQVPDVVRLKAAVEQVGTTITPRAC